ncbi:MAG: substrate-binding domain-containing protein [Lachnospiraceae bacterium]|nr:substrate-binding domain-containing protein [Lachnospiraceae bacterium]
MSAKSTASDKTTAKKMRIGVVLYGLANPFFEDIKKGLYERAAEFGDSIDIELRQTSFDAASQYDAISELEKLKINGLILSPIADARIREKISELKDKKIPTICINSDFDESDRIAFVGTDLYKSGRTAGQVMGMITPPNNWEVGIITGSRAVEGHEARIKGFCDVLKESYPYLTVERIEPCYGDDYKAYETMRLMLEEHPHMHAFYFTAGGVYGGCKFLYQMTKPRPYYVVTFDELDTTRDSIRKGTISASICQQPLSQGRLSLTLMERYLNGGVMPDDKYFTEIIIRIKENL